MRKTITKDYYGVCWQIDTNKQLKEQLIISSILGDKMSN